MPHVEVLPNSTSISAPGWAYVPDTGFDPSKAAIQPSGARKRNARTSGLASGDTTQKQNAALVKRLADLDRDNFKDAQITIPSKKDAGGRGPKGKTPATRKILLAQKTFAMYVADEEALAAQDPHPAVTSTKPRAAPAPATRRPSRSQVTGKETAPPDEANPHAGTVLHGPAFPAENVADLRLLCSVVPAAPSEALMEALVSAAPLSYNAVRAGPAREGRPLRWFCEICGYWGRVRCLNCGARVCGLACKVAHDEDRCQKYPG